MTSNVCESFSSAPDFNSAKLRLTKLREALSAGRSRVSCLRRWSEFIKERDGYRCVDCHSKEGLSAHHICRKSFFDSAQFDTGNGITLCRQCHKEVHAGFNGRPDILMPVDAQGGEKLALMERLYSILLDDAIERGMLCDDFYFLGDNVLRSFKWMQGFDPSTRFPGSRLEQAYLILAEPELPMRQAIAKANGFTMDSTPLLPGGMVIVFGNEASEQSGSFMIRNYSLRSRASDQSDSDE